ERDLLLGEHALQEPVVLLEDPLDARDVHDVHAEPDHVHGDKGSPGGGGGEGAQPPVPRARSTASSSVMARPSSQAAAKASSPSRARADASITSSRARRYCGIGRPSSSVAAMALATIWTASYGRPRAASDNATRLRLSPTW